MQRSLNWIAATALTLGLLAGCGGSGSNATPPNITAAAGGTVTSADGRVTLVVPPGAAARDMTVRIVAASPAVPSNIGVLAGYGYAIEGDGGDLSADAELSITIDAASVPASANDRRRALGAIGGSGPPPVVCPEGTVRSVAPNGSIICEAWPPQPAVLSTSGLASLDTCRFLPANLRLICSVREVLPKTFVLLHDREPPSVSVVATTVPVTTAGSVNFAATVTDNRGLYGVQFLIGRFTGNGWISDTPTVLLAPPFSLQRSFGPADNGTWNLQVAARDNNGNLTHVDLPFVVNIAAGPAPDTTAPAVALGASTTVATVGTTALLSATASDDVGVTRVEFFKGATLLGERTSAPYELTTPAFVAGDVGIPQVFTARAFDAAGNNATSTPLTVAVSAVSTGDVYVNATSGIDSNAGTAAAPFRTLAHAFTAVGSGGTVWLQNGAFTAATEGTDIFTGRTVPAGVTVRAVNLAGASIGFTLNFAGSGSIIDTAFDMSGNGVIQATSGQVLVSRPTWIRLGAFGVQAALLASGSAILTMDNGGDPAHEYFAAAGIGSLASVSGAAEVTVQGGLIDRLSGAGAGFMVGVSDNARVTLNGVTWTNASGAVVAPTAIDVNSDAGSVVLTNTTIDLSGAVELNNGGNACIRTRGPGAVSMTMVTLTGSTLSNCPGDGIQMRNGTPALTLTNTSITRSGFNGLQAGNVFSFQNPAVPVISLSNSSITASQRAGIEMNNGGALTVAGGSYSGNGIALANGGIRLLGAFTYGLSMRGATVSNNFANAASGGVVLQGNAASTFDLGSQSSQGGNFLTLGTNGAGSTSLRANVAAGVVVLGAGNTWNMSAQGSNAAGQYTVPSATCSVNPCVVSSGSGVNYTITGGSLRLVDN